MLLADVRRCAQQENTSRRTDGPDPGVPRERGFADHQSGELSPSRRFHHRGHQRHQPDAGSDRQGQGGQQERTPADQRRSLQAGAGQPGGSAVSDLRAVGDHAGRARPEPGRDCSRRKWKEQPRRHHRPAGLRPDRDCGTLLLGHPAQQRGGGGKHHPAGDQGLRRSHRRQVRHARRRPVHGRHAGPAAALGDRRSQDASDSARSAQRRGHRQSRGRGALRRRQLARRRKTIWLAPKTISSANRARLRSARPRAAPPRWPKMPAC